MTEHNEISDSKNKDKKGIIGSLIVLVIMLGIMFALLGDKQTLNADGTKTTPTPSASPSATKFLPPPRSDTTAKTAMEPRNIPYTPSEKTYYSCLLAPSTLASSSCKAAGKVVSKETNIFGSNMVTKFKYQISEDKVSLIKNAFVVGLNANKVLVNGVDYFPKKGVNELPKNALIFDSQFKSNIATEGAIVFLYDSPQTGKNFCVSMPSFDGKVTWKATLTAPNLFLGTPCSATSLK